MLAQIANFCDQKLLTLLTVLGERCYEIWGVEDVGNLIRVQPEVGGLLGRGLVWLLHANKGTAEGQRE